MSIVGTTYEFGPLTDNSACLKPEATEGMVYSQLSRPRAVPKLDENRPHLAKTGVSTRAVNNNQLAMLLMLLERDGMFRREKLMMKNGGKYEYLN